MTDKNLLERANAAMANSYCPYSRVAVGAAIECRDGSVFTGCTIESCAFGSTICAERAAICNAVSNGHTDFVRIAVISNGLKYSVPCGECRQMLSEFSNDIEVLCGRGDGRYVSYKLRELLPNPYSAENLD